jgi:hypothetical protein
MPKSGNIIIVVFILFKFMRIAFSYTSFLIAKNFTAQIYMEKVLVNGENPPKLVNLIILGFVIEFIMVAICMALLYAVVTQFEMNVVTDKFNIFIQYILPDYFISSMMTFIFGYFIANKMHDKKYFLYKDDGLRAIRALSELMFTISFINTLIPYNFMATGIKYTLKQNSI